MVTSYVLLFSNDRRSAQQLLNTRTVDVLSRVHSLLTV